MNEAKDKLLKEKYRTLLEEWDHDPDLQGGYLIRLLCSESLEVEVRKSGKVTKEFGIDDFRRVLVSAGKTKQQAWSCEPSGIGYSIRFDDQLIGVCILFPAGDAEPLERWEERVSLFSREVALLQIPTADQLPSLQTLAEAIPEHEPHSGQSGKKLHWECSQTRVEVPVKEELAQHLLLDHLPLF